MSSIYQNLFDNQGFPLDKKGYLQAINSLDPNQNDILKVPQIQTLDSEVYKLFKPSDSLLGWDYILNELADLAHFFPKKSLSSSPDVFPINFANQQAVVKLMPDRDWIDMAGRLVRLRYDLLQLPNNPHNIYIPKTLCAASNFLIQERAYQTQRLTEAEIEAVTNTLASYDVGIDRVSWDDENDEYYINEELQNPNFCRTEKGICVFDPIG